MRGYRKVTPPANKTLLVELACLPKLETSKVCSGLNLHLIYWNVSLIYQHYMQIFFNSTCFFRNDHDLFFYSGTIQATMEVKKNPLKKFVGYRAHHNKPHNQLLNLMAQIVITATLFLSANWNYFRKIITEKVNFENKQTSLRIRHRINYYFAKWWQKKHEKLETLTKFILEYIIYYPYLGLAEE